MNKILSRFAAMGIAFGLLFSLSGAFAANKTLTIVTSGTSIPYSMLDEKNNWTGVDADIWAAIAKRKGWNIEIKRAAFDAIFGELDAGRADLAANAFAVRPNRVDKYYPSIPYYGDAQAIVIRADNNAIKTFADLKGKKLGVTNGQASQSIISEMKPQYGFEEVIYEDSNNGLYEMTLGRIDAQACAVTTANLYAEKTGNKIKILDEKLKANNVAFFYPKTEQGAQLRDEVDQELKALLQDGTIAKITEKYFGADMTKLIIPDDAAK
ncbi:amino acid ABC transporter substrate-binding protein (PAAT family) [Mesocricetibacter intestinalis]|uniref:Amino acid ABC transporter substrate-binding protein (PAAT family) n=1 Tax=Mesocricetibacter intestinalis TaxID=1521930 RepID=A0A4R6VBD3_9PAST|nr:transporter substrate-binding domain-containing protein [Mesocricetibacter intestinalis]TDQ57016.1 amino acid ABC transporter substrate-binding protein (PAAT family) [Mesocricetibacter intestinalis]